MAGRERLRASSGRERQHHLAAVRATSQGRPGGQHPHRAARLLAHHERPACPAGRALERLFTPGIRLGWTFRDRRGLTESYPEPQPDPELVPAAQYVLPADLNRCGVLSRLSPAQFADALTEAIHVGTPGACADRAVDVRVLERPTAALGGWITRARLAAAAQAALGHPVPPGLLTPQEEMLIGGDLFPIAYRQQIAPNLVRLDAFLADLAAAVKCFLTEAILHRDDDISMTYSPLAKPRWPPPVARGTVPPRAGP